MLIKKILDVFSFGKLQDTVTILTILEKNNITISEFIDFIEGEKMEKAKLDLEKIELEKKERHSWNKFALKCPECKEPMGLFPINTELGDQTGDDSQSVWICPNNDCMETIYNKQTIQEILKKGGK